MTDRAAFDGSAQSGAGAPKCKICGNNHWLRVGCDGLQFGGGRLAGKTAATNTPREGHDVLKGSAKRGHAAPTTSSASTESPDPSYPRARLGIRANTKSKKPGTVGSNRPQAAGADQSAQARVGTAEVPHQGTTPAKRKRAKKRKAKRGGKKK